MAQVQATDYKAVGQKIAAANGIPWPIFDALVHQESGWDPTATSPVGAKGFTQLMPATAKGLGVTNINDPMQQLTGGAKYLKMQFDRFKDWKLALAAYNAGPGAVAKYGGVPPYAETQRYVANIMAASGAGGSGLPAGAGSPPPGPPALPGQGFTLPGLHSLSALLNLGRPSDASVDQLGSLGGLAAKTAKAAQAPIDPAQQLGLPQPDAPQPAASGAPDTGAGQTDPYATNTIPIGKTFDGSIPMVTGGNIRAKYPNLSAASHVDWEHVNPRLLKVINDQAARMGVVAVLNSGYRSNQYSAANGGFANDPHTKGVAVDAYVNGHPIGDVIPPEVWAKAGVRSGNTPGFYKGKTDPEHLDLIGIPIKGGNK